MLIMPSFKKSLIVEQFQGNYLKHITLRTLSKERNVFNSIALVPSFLFSFKINCFSSSVVIPTNGGRRMFNFVMINVVPQIKINLEFLVKQHRDST